MIRINQLKLQIPHTEEALEKKIQKTLHLKKGDSFTYRIHRQSLDARRKPELFYVYTVDVTVSNENAILKHCKGNIQKVEEKHYQIPSHGTETLNARPVVIGSGPAGLTAAIYASRARLRTLVLERDTMGAGQIAVTEQVDNYPGLLHIGGYELGEKFREHAESLGASICENDVERLTKQDGVFQIALADGTTVSAKSVIYAAGTSYRKLDVPGAELPGVSYCATCDGAFYQGKTVAVIGGGDTALGDALYLARMAKTVYLVHRRDAFRANAALQESVKQTENIVLVTNAVPTAVVGEKRVSVLQIDHSGQPEELTLDGVFVAIGSVPNTEPLRGLADLDAHGYVKAGEDGITSLDGLFAAGDVRTKLLRQVVTAAADGANCVASAEQYLLQNEKRW